jgi:hypothetical protein|tara:strand:- start:1401 stop:1664 length:264 start_codon:yes stop_codon:yes gene_type:complete
MKLFFFKSILILFLFLLGFHYSFNYTIKFIKNEINNNLSKEKIELIKSKIREEMRVAIDKDVFISVEDSSLINSFLNKISSDLKQNK